MKKFLSFIWNAILMTSSVNAGMLIFTKIFKYDVFSAFLLSAGCLIAIVFLMFCIFELVNYISLYAILGLIIYPLKTLLERNERYAGIFHLDKLRKLNKIYNLDNSKTIKENIHFNNRNLFLWVRPADIIYEEPDISFIGLTLIGDSLMIGFKDKTSYTGITKFSYFGFMLWNVVIMKRIKNLEQFNMEMSILLIDKI